MILSKSTTVLIATFSPWKNGKRLPINGNLEPMLDFFSKKVGKTVLIDQVYPGSDFVLPRVEIHKNGKMKLIKPSLLVSLLSPILKLSNTDATHTIFKIRDFLSVLTCPKNKEAYDVFIGFECVNAVAGIVLRKFGKVKKVIYYVSDYTPKRYANPLFNSAYLWLDRFAAENSDYVWDVSKAMLPARQKEGYKGKTDHIMHVPNALYTSQLCWKEEKDIEEKSLVFMGTLGKENGPDLAIETLPLVLKKIKGTTLHIVGGGREGELLSLAKKLKVEKNVVFHGFVGDRKGVSDLISQYSISLAPYRNFKGSARLYGDATKIRAYTAAGLPVITTFVPPLGEEIEQANAGIRVRDNNKDFSEAIVKVLNDKKLYRSLRKNAIEFARNNTWENVYRKAFKDMK